MKIPDYSRLFTKASLTRANDYINDIENINISSKGISCRVVGSARYKVNIAWNKDEYTNLSCTCPYDHGGYCKHIAAVLKYIERQDEKIIKKLMAKKPEWQQIIEGLSEVELRNFLLKHATDNEQIQNALLIDYSKESDTVDIAKYKNIIEKIYNSSLDFDGYLDYRSINDLLQQLSDLQDKSKQFIKKKKYFEAFSINAAIAEESIDIVEEVDDSDGEIGALIYDAFDEVEKVFSVCSNNKLQKYIFEWLQQQMDNTDYSSYGCDDNLESLYYSLAKYPAYVDSILNYLDKKINILKNKSDWSSRYTYNGLLHHKIDILKYQGKNKEVEKLIDANLYLKDFRQIRISQFIKNQDYKKAIEYIKEGINISGINDTYGITHEWRRQLLEIYQSQGMRNELKELSKQMFLDNNNSIEYYKLYKSTFEKAQWKEECKCIIQKMKPQGNNRFYYFPRNLAAIYIEEKMWSELFNEVKKSKKASIVKEYLRYLKNDYPEDLLLILENDIVKLAHNTGRKIYEEVKEYLMEMTKLSEGRRRAEMLRDKLLATYKNRRAMIEILEKL